MSGFVLPSGTEIPWILKSPGGVLDYHLDWGSWLEAGESLTGSPTWDVPAGLSVGATPVVGTKTYIWLSGGVVGTDYLVQCTVTTSESRTDTRSFTVRVRDR